MMDINLQQLIIYALIAGGFYMQWRSLQNCMNKSMHRDEYEPRSRDQ